MEATGRSNVFQHSDGKADKMSAFDALENANIVEPQVGVEIDRNGEKEDAMGCVGDVGDDNSEEEDDWGRFEEGNGSVRNVESDEANVPQLEIRSNETSQMSAFDAFENANNAESQVGVEIAMNGNKEDAMGRVFGDGEMSEDCLLYTSPSPRDKRQSRMPSSA